MKKVLISLSMLAVVLGASAQSFKKGDKVVDLGIGFGVADAMKGEMFGGIPTYKETSTGTFTQKLSFEYGILDLSCGSIGVGAMITNAYGFGVNGIAMGEYDYTYTIDRYHRVSGRQKWEKYQTSEKRRHGVVTGEGTSHIDDLNILIKGSFHKEFVEGLDTYATLGLGASICKYSVSPGDDITFERGQETLDKNSSNNYQFVYYYNDEDHVKWQGGSTKARFAMALSVGARYYFTSNWGINAEFGLTSASFKKNAGVYNILSFGATYKF